MKLITQIVGAFIVSFLIAAMIIACSSEPLTEDQKYERDNRKQLVIEDYNRRVAACARAGGGMYHRNARYRGRHLVLDPVDMKMAECVRF